MPLLTPAEWGAAADAGATTYSVGKAGAWAATYSEFKEAAAAATAEGVEHEPGEVVVRWDGHQGHQVPATEILAWLDNEADAEADAEAEAG